MKIYQYAKYSYIFYPKRNQLQKVGITYFLLLRIRSFTKTLNSITFNYILIPNHTNQIHNPKC